jgi:hypothetical protein
VSKKVRAETSSVHGAWISKTTLCDQDVIANNQRHQCHAKTILGTLKHLDVEK